MATLPKLDDSPLLAQPAASLRGIQLDSSGMASAALSAERERREGMRYIAKGLNDVGDALDEVQLADDKRAAKDQLTQYSADLRKALYGDGTPENPGYYNLRGDAAVNGRKQLEESIEKMRKDYLGRSSNKRSALLFNDASITITVPELDNVALHVGKEKREAEKTSSLAAMDEAVSRFAANPSPQSAEMNGLILEQEVLSQADAEGITDKATRATLVRQARSKMYKEGISTALQRDVDAGQAMYLQYRDQIDGQDQSVIENDIHVAQRAKQAEIEHRAVMSRLAAEQSDKAAFGEWASKIGKGDAVAISDIAADPRMDGSSKLTLYNAVRSFADNDTPSEISKTTTSNLYARMLLPEDNPGKLKDEGQIVQEFVNKKLSRTDFDWLLKSFQEMRTEDGQKLTTQLGKFFAGTKSLITKGNAFVNDPQGDLNFYNYQQYVQDRINEYRHEGKDPYELLRPGSKDFLGAPEVLGQFQNDLQTTIQNKANQMNGKGPKPATEVSPVYKTPEDVINAYKTGKVTWDAAAKWLNENGHTVPAAK